MITYTIALSLLLWDQLLRLSSESLTLAGIFTALVFFRVSSEGKMDKFVALIYPMFNCILATVYLENGSVIKN